MVQVETRHHISERPDEIPQFESSLVNI